MTKPNHAIDLPVDQRGFPYKGTGPDAYYVSTCHGAPFTYTEGVLNCKNCYEEADDVRQGMSPTVAETPAFIAFEQEIVRRALRPPPGQ